MGYIVLSHGKYIGCGGGVERKTHKQGYTHTPKYKYTHTMYI